MELIEITYSGMDRSDVLDEHVREEIEHALDHQVRHVTRVIVRLADENAGKGGPADRRCTIEARPAAMKPIAVEDTGDDIHAVVSSAAAKLKRALTRRFERAEESDR